MALPDVQGLDTLYQAISEALEIEKCSICLERLENTVLLWPCTHWYCNNCIKTLHRSFKGEKVSCPLCKSVTTRRKVLSFQDKQKEYEDLLQTLVGALSLDLKFDVTSYNNVRKHEISTVYKIVEPTKPLLASTSLKKPGIKESVRVIDVKIKSDSKKIQRRANRRSGKLQPITNNSVRGNESNTTPATESSKTVPELLPASPGDSPKVKKVKEWLNSNKFSQADQDTGGETIVVDVHKADHDESLCFSETALQSVSQVEYRREKTPIRPILTKKPVGTPSDVDAIKVLDNSSEKFPKVNPYKTKKVIRVAAVEKFDELFPENRKVQTVTTTYGSKNPNTLACRRGQRFAVQVDLFENMDGNKCEDEDCSSGENMNNSEGSVIDFSSGSGEMWTLEKKTRKRNALSKRKTLKNTNEVPQRKKKNSIGTFVNKKSTRSRVKNTMKDLEKIDIRNSSPLYPNRDKDDINKAPVKLQVVHGEKYIKPKEDIVKEIIDDWNDTKDSNSLNLVKNQTLAGHNGDTVVPVYKDEQIPLTKSGNHSSKLNLSKTSTQIYDKINTPCKETSSRSPGWSRLKSTKKEFHLSEKKKLNLKTFNKSKSNTSLSNIGISPLSNKSSNVILHKANHDESIDYSVQNKSSFKNDVIEESSKKLDVHSEMKNPELSKNFNISTSSSMSASSFRGFPSPEGKEFSKPIVSISDSTNKIPEQSDASTHYQRKSDVGVDSVISKGFVVPSPVVSKEDSMEVDVPGEQEREQELVNLQSPVQLKNYPNENTSFEGLKTSNNLNILQQESQGSPAAVSKKRDRDSGIHNESGISSPIRKRICRDAEVQTSPGRMQSVIRDMLKDMCGAELEEIINMSNKASKPLKSVEFTESHQCLTRLSQGSDKENVDFSSNNQNPFKSCLDDSDVVYGTENNLAITQLNPKVGIFHTRNALGTLEVAKHMSYSYQDIDDDDVDPDAPTQPYKTPVVPKRPLQTSTKEYTIVSNPSSSEIKKIDSLFNKSDIVFPDETPKGMTPWNYSGVGQLMEKSGTAKKSVDENAILLSQGSKEKANKSRRQLDFVEENSTDIFEFERQTLGNSKEDEVNYVLNDLDHSDGIKISHDRIDEIDDIFMESNRVLDKIMNPTNPNQKEEVHTRDKNTLMVTCEDVNNEQENDCFSDTPGVVGPSEPQSFGKGGNAFAPNKQSDSNKNIAGDLVTKNVNKSEIKIVNTDLPPSTGEAMKDSSDINQDSPCTTKVSLPEQKETSIDFVHSVRDGVSSPSSDVSFVEGTPDVSQNECNQPGVLSIEDNIESDVQPQVVDTLEVHSDRGKENPTTSSGGPRVKDLSQSKDEELRQKEKRFDEDGSDIHQTIKNTETEEGHLCFASSLLNPHQNQVLACVLGGMGLTYSKTVGPHVSHLIVGTKNGCFQNTYKVLLAMALHKPIIRFDWVEQVIRTGGTVPLDPFVALDPSGECGVLRAEADKNRELLQSFAIHIYNVNDRIVLKEQIEELVKLCGGIVVKELHDFCNVPRDKFRIIVLSEPPDSLTQGDWRQKYSAAEVMIDWIYNTIGRYRVMPLIPFMVTDASDAVPFLQHEGYPKELIFDMFTQE